VFARLIYCKGLESILDEMFEELLSDLSDRQEEPAHMQEAEELNEEGGEGYEESEEYSVKSASEEDDGEKEKQVQIGAEGTEEEEFEEEKEEEKKPTVKKPKGKAGKARKKIIEKKRNAFEGLKSNFRQARESLEEATRRQRIESKSNSSAEADE
jgi:hypothetical protein